MSPEAKTATLALVLAAAALAAAPAHKPPRHARALTAADMPVPRAGQWEKTSNEDGEVKTSRHCEDGKPVKNLDLGKDCQPSVVTRSKTGGWVITAHCAHEGSQSVAVITAEGDFATAFVSDLVVDITRPDGKHDISKMHAAYRYIGACPAGETTP